MPAYVVKTDAIQRIVLPASLRAFWSSVLTANRSDVWIRVEAQGVADGASVAVEVHRVEEGKGPVEKLGSLSGGLSGGVFEQRYRVDIEPAKLQAVKGPVTLVVTARVDAYALRAESQALAVARPRFSI